MDSGLKRSVNYEMFVQQQRQRLREDMGLCEKATKKILHYSNNFLYKKLKTVEGVSYQTLMKERAWPSHAMLTYRNAVYRGNTGSMSQANSNLLLRFLMRIAAQIDV